MYECFSCFSWVQDPWGIISTYARKQGYFEELSNVNNAGSNGREESLNGDMDDDELEAENGEFEGNMDNDEAEARNGEFEGDNEEDNWVI